MLFTLYSSSTLQIICLVYFSEILNQMKWTNYHSKQTQAKVKQNLLLIVPWETKLPPGTRRSTVIYTTIVHFLPGDQWCKDKFFKTRKTMVMLSHPISSYICWLEMSQILAATTCILQHLFSLQVQTIESCQLLKWIRFWNSRCKKSSLTHLTNRWTVSGVWDWCMQILISSFALFQTGSSATVPLSYLENAWTVSHSYFQSLAATGVGMKTQNSHVASLGRG